MRRGLAVAAAVALLGGRASAQARIMSDAAAREVTLLADSASKAGAPVSALRAKAGEGLLKGADDARIVAAVRSLLGELLASRQALGPQSGDADVIAAASALHAGATTADLRRLVRAMGRDRGRSLAVPFTVFADLLTRAVPREAAVSQLARLLEQHAREADFSVMRSAIEMDIARGVSPGTSLERRASAMLPP
ncbi:MAG: hypothetical protein JWO05_3706 [Gemmatimonadetes bacterium]|nr:hypothetical protein [Gemmatimonadota bacterium]